MSTIPNVQRMAPVYNLALTQGIQWSQPADGTIKTNSRSTDINAVIQELSTDIRSDLNRLCQCHRVLMASKHFAEEYKTKHTDQQAHYDALKARLKKAVAAPPSAEVLSEVKEIADTLALDKSYVDTLFLQVAYRAGFLHFLMSSVVADIGFEDLQTEAKTALKEMEVLSSELYTKSSSQKDRMRAQTAVHIFVIFDELSCYENRIKHLKEENDSRAKTTNKRVFGVTMGFFALVIFSAIGLAYFGDSWNTTKDYKIIGVPLGVFLWSLIGSFAAMITQYYKNPVYQFGNTFKWVFVRPVLGVLMAAGIYLALYALIIDEQTTSSDLLPFLVAFFVGYSDSFSLDLIGSIQDVITSLFSNKPNNNNRMNAPLAPVIQPPIPVAVQPTASTTPPASNPTSTSLPLQPNPDHFSGEDEQ